MKLMKVLLIICDVLGILFWGGILFYSVVLGGSPGPGYERSVPYIYCGIMTLGLMGSGIGLAGIGIAQKRKLLLLAAVLGEIGSVPLFLLELPVVGVFFLIVGLTPLLGFLLRQN